MTYMQTLPGFLPESPTLNLAFDTVGDIDIDNVLTYLTHRQAPLASLHLDGQSVHSLDDQTFLLLIEALNRFSTLHTLSFKQTELHLSEAGPSAKLRLLQQSLCSPYLKTLDLTGKSVDGIVHSFYRCPQAVG